MGVFADTETAERQKSITSGMPAKTVDARRQATMELQRSFGGAASTALPICGVVRDSMVTMPVRKFLKKLRLGMQASLAVKWREAIREETR